MKQIYPFTFYGTTFKNQEQLYKYFNLKKKNIVCKYCGNKIKRYLYKDTYCSNKCYYKDRFKNISPSEWQRTRKIIILIYNNKCAKCGKEGKHVHHIKPISKYGDHSLNNLILLCPKCHAKEHVKLRQQKKKDNV